mgnify:FL=1
MTKEIWIINHYATSMFENQSGRHYYFAKYLQNYGFKVTIYCANQFHKQSKEISIKSGKSVTRKVDRIAFKFIKTVPSVGNGLKRLLNMWMFYKNVTKVMKSEINSRKTLNLIIGSSVHPLSVKAALKIGKPNNIPVIAEIRDLWPEAIAYYGKLKENSLVYKRIQKWEKNLYVESDAIIFTKPGDHEYIIENGWNQGNSKIVDLNKCYYINNGIDMKTFEVNLQNHPKPVKGSKKHVTYVGAIRPVNEIEKIVRTAELLRQNKDVVFDIYGSGSELERLKKLAESLKLSNINFHGSILNQYVPSILTQSDVNLLTYSQTKYNWSRGNSSNKLFEYLAAGKPIVSTFSMGFSLFNEREIGTEIHNASPLEIADAILKYLDMDSQTLNQIRVNAQEMANRFDYKNLSEKLLSIIKKTVLSNVN